MSKRTTQARPACSGVMPGPSSWPCSGSPASSRSVSRAPSPAGEMPASSSAASTPPPRRRERAARRRPRRCSRCRRSSRGAPPNVERFHRESGDPPRARAHDRRQPFPRLGTLHRQHGARRGDVVDLALAPTVEHRRFTERVEQRLRCSTRSASRGSRPAPTHHTMMSSTTCASSGSSRWVYCARPGPMRSRSLVNAHCSVGERAGAVHAHRAEVRHVEHHRVLAARAVLLEHAGVLDGHLPPAERHHAGAERAVLGVEQRVSHRARRGFAHAVCWHAVSAAGPAGLPRRGSGNEVERLRLAGARRRAATAVRARTSRAAAGSRAGRAP